MESLLYTITFEDGRVFQFKEKDPVYVYGCWEDTKYHTRLTAPSYLRIGQWVNLGNYTKKYRFKGRETQDLARISKTQKMVS